eukprot:scaffold47347_cov31-Prasinocladus_malaysianus.AAC.3
MGIATGTTSGLHIDQMESIGEDADAATHESLVAIITNSDGDEVSSSGRTTTHHTVIIARESSASLTRLLLEPPNPEERLIHEAGKAVAFHDKHMRRSLLTNRRPTAQDAFVPENLASYEYDNTDETREGGGGQCRSGVKSEYELAGTLSRKSTIKVDDSLLRDTRLKKAEHLSVARVMYAVLGMELFSTASRAIILILSNTLGCAVAGTEIPGCASLDLFWAVDVPGTVKQTFSLQVRHGMAPSMACSNKANKACRRPTIIIILNITALTAMTHSYAYVRVREGA